MPAAPAAVYLRLVRAGFRQRSAYRAAMVAGVVANSAFGFIRIAVFFAVADANGGTVAGYQAASLSTYTWLSQALLGPLNLWGSDEISQRIRTGDIAVDLARPVDLQAGHLAQDLGGSLAMMLPRSLPTLLIGALTVGIALPTTVLPWVLGLLSVVLGLVVSYLARFIVQVIGFWTVEVRGIQRLYGAMAGVFGGLIVPVHFMPDGFRAVVLASPFPSMLQTPVDILSGRSDVTAALTGIAIQVAWIAGLAGAGRILLRAGQSRLLVQGG